MDSDAVDSTGNGSNGAPIGPHQAPSEASTESADSNFSDAVDDDAAMTMTDMVGQLEGFEDQLFEMSSILQFMSVKVSTMKNLLQKLSEQRE